MAQHVEITLKIEHMLAAALTPLVACNQPAGLPDLAMRRMDAGFDPAAGAGWHQLEVGLRCHAALLVYHWKPTSAKSRPSTAQDRR